MTNYTHDHPRWDVDSSTIQRNSKVVVLAALLIVLGVVATFRIGALLGLRGGDEPEIRSTGPTIEHVQSLNQLVTTRVSIADVLTGEGDGVRGIWLIKGDALLGIDLSDVNVRILDRQKRRAVIGLTRPVVLSARVDHQRSMTWDVQRTTWIPWRGNQDRLRDKAMYHAQKLVEYAATQPELIEEAKRNASHAIVDLYRTVDWTVEIRWR